MHSRRAVEPITSVKRDKWELFWNYRKSIGSVKIRLVPETRKVAGTRRIYLRREISKKRREKKAENIKKIACDKSGTMLYWEHIKIRITHMSILRFENIFTI